MAIVFQVSVFGYLALIRIEIVLKMDGHRYLISRMIMAFFWRGIE
jgi:hypothetical protein